MAYEIIDNGISVQCFGSVFVPELTVEQDVIVDGDLIADYVRAPRIELRHGSLIAPRIECPRVHADILGVFDLSGPYQPPVHWTYEWLRPVTEMPREIDWKSETSIERVAALFLHPALVRDPAMIQPLIERVLARKSCGRARVLFTVALELVEGRDVLTPLGTQVAECFLQHERLPDAWRF